MIKYYQGLTIEEEYEFDFDEILKEFRNCKKLTGKGGLLAPITGSHVVRGNPYAYCNTSIHSHYVELNLVSSSKTTLYL